ncbi:hypothetical protein [Haloarchaeobius baliensis]|uniref:hypothetical protein n=1 Tax=Haloarchaeobius baliensis TaxID=1670458 RepID=UPI003F88523A
MNPNDLPPEDQPRPTEEEAEEIEQEQREEAREEMNEEDHHILKCVQYGVDSEGERVADSVEYIPTEQIDPEDLGSMKSAYDTAVWMTYSEADEDAQQYSDDQLLHD